MERQQQWTLVVRRSFGISDLVGDEEATKALIGRVQDQLQESGWQGPRRAVAEPMVHALLGLETSGDLDDRLVPTGLGISAPTSVSREAACRLIDKGMTVVDPEHLVFDMSGDYAPEVVVVAQKVLDQICQYVCEQPS